MSLIGMGTTCVLPHRLEDAFRLAAETGFDGVEVMVTHDRRTQSSEALDALSMRYGVPVLSVHAPVFARSSLVFGLDPLEKITRSAHLAAELGARTVVAHPPYAWQRRSAARFVDHVRQVSSALDVRIAIENMFPVRAGTTRDVFAPSWNPGDLDIDWLTLDFSHAGMSGRPATELTAQWGARLGHVHLCDSSAAPAGDEHLPPGEGVQPVAEVLGLLASTGFDGLVIAEISTKRCGADDGMRARLLEKTLRFVRSHLRTRV